MTKGTYITRLLETELLDFISNQQEPFNTILLGGPRQCGKSTMLKHLFPPDRHIHINLAEESAFCDAIDTTQCFDDLTVLIESRYHTKIGSGRIIIFDEAQLSHKLGNYVRFFKENWKTQTVIITGSTLSNLFTHTEKPTGRVVEFVLRPFNFSEFLDALGQDSLRERLKNWTPEKPFSDTVHRELVTQLQSYLVVGGLPDVVLTYSRQGNHTKLLADIFAFYKRDFQSKLSSENLTSIFSQVFARIAASTGSEIKLSSIIASSSPGYRKLRDVLTIMEMWHQIIRVDYETYQLTKFGTTTPKRYLFDQGIRYLLNPSRFVGLDLLDSAHPKREEIGGLLENFVLTELISTNSPFAIRSWAKTHQSGMVDFLYNTEKDAFAIEVKAALSLDRKHFSALLSYHEVYPNTHLILVNLDKGGVYQTKEGATITSVPAYAICRALI